MLGAAVLGVVGLPALGAAPGTAGGGEPAFGPPAGLVKDLNTMIGSLETAIEQASDPETPAEELKLRADAIQAEKLKLVETYFAPAQAGPGPYGVSYSELFSRLDCIDRNLHLAASLPAIEDLVVHVKSARLCLAKLDGALKDAPPELSTEFGSLRLNLVKLLHMLTGLEESPASADYEQALAAARKRAAKLAMIKDKLIVEKFFKQEVYGTSFAIEFEDLDCVDAQLDLLSFPTFTREDVLDALKQAEGCASFLAFDFHVASHPFCPLGGDPRGDPLSAAMLARAGRCVTLTLTKSGTGSGVVKSQPPGIDCGATCSVTEPDGTSVSLAASADSGSVFAGWMGACGPGPVACTVKLTKSETVDAVFNKLSTRTASGSLSDESHGLLGYSIQTNQPADAFELILPQNEAIGGVSFPAAFSEDNCTDRANVETCTNGTIAPNTPLMGVFAHEGTIAANCGCVQVAFSSDNGVTWLPSPPATLGGPPASSPPTGDW